MQSSSFELLDRKMQKWVWQQGWTSLKEIQENSIQPIINGNNDAIVSASTAGGKTEAVFLPVISSIIQKKSSPGYDVLYISPLKALINDQYRRLSDMLADTDVNVTPWHGDVGFSKKKSSLKNPNGILIITPESLESFLINKSLSVSRFFSSLSYVVIDELHSFIGTERGKQLQSLLSRIEHLINKNVPRIAMSATFSDYDTVKTFLRNDMAFPCFIPEQGKSNHVTKILVKEYTKKDSSTNESIANDLYLRLRGSNNLIFTNNRNDAELYTVLLSDLCMKDYVPNEFRVHHGSISKIERESVERDLQMGLTPVTAVCTSTMELGIDIGKVKSVTQIGAATSTSSLRQRLGRSGRTGKPSILRVYSVEDIQGVMENIRGNLVQNIAIIELMLKNIYEQQSVECFHFSTLIQQILSVLSEFGSFYPKDCWILLCKDGAFRNVTPELFIKLLNCLGENEIISQLNNGQIVIGRAGEKIIKKTDFYIAFNTVIDYTVIDEINSKCIGSLQQMPNQGQVIILSAKRWLVCRIDELSSTVWVQQAENGGDVTFIGNPISIDSVVSKAMFNIYKSNSTYPYLDKKSQTDKQLEIGRTFFKKFRLDKTPFITYSGEFLMFTWAGQLINRTISFIALKVLGKSFAYNHLYINGLTLIDVETILNRGKSFNGTSLASLIDRKSKINQKYDNLLSDDLLNLEYANTYLDVDSAWLILQQCCKNHPTASCI